MVRDPEKYKDEMFKGLRAYNLKPDQRIALQMIVMDSDKKASVEFLTELDLKLNQEEAFNICRRWLKAIERGEQGKLNIRLTDKGPRID